MITVASNSRKPIHIFLSDETDKSHLLEERDNASENYVTSWM